MWKTPLWKLNAAIAITKRRAPNPMRQSAKLFSSSFYSSPSEHFQEPVPVLYSFLRPTLFSPPTPSPQSTSTTPTPTIPRQTPDPAVAAAHQSALLASINASDTDEAWKSFKALTSFSHSPPQDLTFSLIAHLCSLNDLHNLKRAFTSAIFLLEKNPTSISFQSLQTLFSAFHSAGTHAPAFALVKSMFKNRVFPPFSVWGGALTALTKARRGGGLGTAAEAFLEVFGENCRIAAEEGVRAMVPDLGAFNAAMDVCCREMGSVLVAKRIVETMSVLGVRPDVETFGAMGYLFAWKGMEARIVELEELIRNLGFADKTVIIHENLIRGYIKSGDPKAVAAVVMRSLRESKGKEGCRNSSWKGFSDEAYGELVNCFVKNNGGGGGIKDLAGLIIESQEFDERPGDEEEEEEKKKIMERSVGFGIVNACVHLDMLDKAHSILDEMTARGASVGIGVYSSILKAYCKERRTAEAAQLVTQVNAAGLQLDSGSYGALIDASMSVQDFHSAFSLFRGMRDSASTAAEGSAKFDLKMNYLTIMTGLMENHRPELMAGFLDTVFDDPRVEVATHDWNSIIHAFCKVGRLEDARRTYRRMIFLQFDPNEQTYLSLINGYVCSEKYFSVLLLWTDVKKKKQKNETSGFELKNALVDALLYALVKGGFFDAAMEVVERSQELKIFIDKWRYKQAFMETHKKLKVTKLRRKNTKKMGALVAFKNWVGLNV